MKNFVPILSVYRMPVPQIGDLPMYALAALPDGFLVREGVVHRSRHVMDPSVYDAFQPPGLCESCFAPIDNEDPFSYCYPFSPAIIDAKTTLPTILRWIAKGEYSQMRTAKIYAPDNLDLDELSTDARIGLRHGFHQSCPYLVFTRGDVAHHKDIGKVLIGALEGQVVRRTYTTSPDGIPFFELATLLP